MEDLTTAGTAEGSSYGPDLRRRAAELGELARSIEQAIVMTLIDDVDETERRAPSARDRLNRAMLERNLHQLHRAADELRGTAMRFRERADELPCGQYVFGIRGPLPNHTDQAGVALPAGRLVHPPAGPLGNHGLGAAGRELVVLVELDVQQGRRQEELGAVDTL